MVEQAQVSSAISSQAGPREVENRSLSETNMRRATQQIGRRLALIGDDLNSRWREKLPQQQALDWQAYPNTLIWRAINRRIVGSLRWSEIVPMARASRLVPELHTQACQATMKWIGWMKPRFPEWSCKTKCFLASAALLLAATVFTASRI